MTIKISTLAANATPSPTKPITFGISEIEKERTDLGLPKIISVSMGEWHTNPHPHFDQEKSYKYSASGGNDKTLAIIIELYQNKYPSISFSKNNVVCTLGQEQGFFDLSYLLIDPNDVVLSVQQDSVYSSQLEYRGGKLESKPEHENIAEYLKRAIKHFKVKAIFLNTADALSEAEIEDVIKLLEENPQVAIIIDNNQNIKLLEKSPSLWERCIIIDPNCHGLATGKTYWREIIVGFQYLSISGPPLSTQEMILETDNTLERNKFGQDPKGRDDYSANAGNDKTLEAIAGLYKRWYPDIKITKDNVICTLGATHALFNFVNVLKKILKPGDKVATFEPYFFGLYYRQLETVDIELVGISTTKQEKFRPTAKKLEQAIKDGAKVIYINDPNNPTGISLTSEEIFALGDVLQRYSDTIVVFDGSNSGVSFLPEQLSFLKVYPSLWKRCVIIDSCTKILGGMPDARIGMLATGNAEWRRLMAEFQSNTIPGPSLAIQEMICQIADHIEDKDVIAWSRECLLEYKENSQYLHTALADLNLAPLQESQGTFYLFACVNHLIRMKIPDSVTWPGTNGESVTIRDIHKKIGNTQIETDKDIVYYLLHVAGVATLPGSAYQKIPSKDNFFLRISCAQPKIILEQAVKNIRHAISLLARPDKCPDQAIRPSSPS